VSRYLSEEEVLDSENPFVQLLSGVVWLIRNGSVYINESQATECDETQETGGGGLGWRLSQQLPWNQEQSGVGCS
jgi:hypothetical protein